MNSNPSTARQRDSLASRLISPTTSFFFCSNDDQLERAEARAARAATIRRKSLTSTASLPPPPPDPCLSREQIVDLFQTCIKLSSQNKINQKNTWELKLIDHLSEIIKVEADDDAETNFQKASCTLEAGVKIYSLRVDSVHSEAYKVLGWINIAGRENEKEITDRPDNIKTEQEEARVKEEFERKVSPLSTLESSYETLTIKKLDVAFTIDPLYRQASAQFDEGGAKGLLLNNLGVYGRCCVLFDSLEIPGKSMPCSTQNNNSDTIDLSFARECIDQMVLNMPAQVEISPTLNHIICQLDEDNRGVSPRHDIGERSTGKVKYMYGIHQDVDDNSFGSNEACAFDQDDQTSCIVDENPYFTDLSFQSDKENDPQTSYEPDVDDRFESVSGFCFQRLIFSSVENAWAGPDHWKYQKSKANIFAGESKSACTRKRSKDKELAKVDITFTNFFDKEISDIFAPPHNPKSVLLPENRPPCANKLPEDCHYQPEDLVKLFLLPNILCFGKRRKPSADYSKEQCINFLPSNNNGSVLSGQYDDIHSDVEDSDSLVPEPRQVNKIEVEYNRTFKQVDVHALKETLWDQIQESNPLPQKGCEDTISFKQVLASFTNDGRVAAADDISPHLCFICLLHLANEHGLSIHDCPTLDDLTIFFPSSQSIGRVG